MTNIEPHKVVNVGKMPDDKFYVNNVMQGFIPNNRTYPIVFDVVEPTGEDPFYKSQSFYRQYLDSIDKTGCPLDIPQQYLTSFLIGIRDVFIANELRMLRDHQREVAIRMINSIDFTIGHIATDFITISPYPTASHSLLRFMKLDLDKLGELDVYYAIHPKDYRYVFVDPTELGYHNFDHILDFATILRFDNVENLSRINVINKADDSKGRKMQTKTQTQTQTQTQNKGKQIVIFKICDELNKFLLDIDSWNLYNFSSANSPGRGGKRLLFKSEALAQILGKMVEPMLSPKEFHSVNNIFRYNNFIPSDNKFTSHFDTPYRGEHVMSRYTLIIYLTGGSNTKPVLTIDDHKIFLMEKATAVLFHQKYEHEGNPYLDSDKIFIRTEVICKGAKLYSDQLVPNDACKVFNSACYFTTQSTKLGELSTYTSKLFNLSTQLHFGLPTLEFCIPILIKKFNNVYFATNGFDYWFCSNIKRVDASVIILIDFFNGFTKNTKQRTSIIKVEYGITDYSNVYGKIKVWDDGDNNSGHDWEEYYERCSPKRISKNCIVEEYPFNKHKWNTISTKKILAHTPTVKMDYTGVYNTNTIADDYLVYLNKLKSELNNDYCCGFGNPDMFELNIKHNSIIYESLRGMISKHHYKYLEYMRERDRSDGVEYEDCDLYDEFNYDYERDNETNNNDEEIYLAANTNFQNSGCEEIENSDDNPNNFEVINEVDYPDGDIKYTQSDITREVAGHSLILMDSDIYIELDDMLDTGSTITFKNTGFQNKINFASCWCDEYGTEFSKNYVRKNVNIKTYALPKIDYICEEQGTRFNICYFRNMFNDTANEQQLRMPMIINTKLSDYV